jgi:hypothetical protein
MKKTETKKFKQSLKIIFLEISNKKHQTRKIKQEKSSKTFIWKMTNKKS